MPTFNPITVASTLRKLFTTCPLPSANADPEAALRVFFENLDGHGTEAIVAAANKFMQGDVAGYNPAFAPTVPQFMTQVRLIEERSQIGRNLRNQAIKQLEARKQDEDFEAAKSAESRKRVADLAKLTAMGLVPDKKEDPEYRKRVKEQVAKEDELFADQFEVMPNGIKVSKYLLKTLNYTVGYERED